MVLYQKRFSLFLDVLAERRESKVLCLACEKVKASVMPSPTQKGKEVPCGNVFIFAVNTESRNFCFLTAVRPLSPIVTISIRGHDLTILPLVIEYLFSFLCNWITVGFLSLCNCGTLVAL